MRFVSFGQVWKKGKRVQGLFCKILKLVFQVSSENSCPFRMAASEAMVKNHPVSFH